MQALPLIMDTTVQARARRSRLRPYRIRSDQLLAVALLAAMPFTWHSDMATSPARARAQAINSRHAAASSRSGRTLVTAARAATAFWVLRQDEADALAARAVAQDPTNGWAWERHGMARLFGGGDPKQAIADFNRALRLRGPSLSRINCLTGIAGAYCASDQMTDALLWRRKALAENPAATWLYGMDACTALEAGDWSRFVVDVDCMRRGQPELSISLLKDCYPPVYPSVLDAFRRAGMPLT